jgi:hypothetical protein
MGTRQKTQANNPSYETSLSIRTGRLVSVSPEPICRPKFSPRETNIKRTQRILNAGRMSPSVTFIVLAVGVATANRDEHVFYRTISKHVRLPLPNLCHQINCIYAGRSRRGVIEYTPDFCPGGQTLKLKRDRLEKFVCVRGVIFAG